METLKFKTTIKCAGCMEKITPFMDEKLSREEWNVDIFTPSKVLTVISDKVTAEEVESTVKKAGFQIERINE
ncbi:MAG: hypothetical protein A3D31_15490 [Candidatus Fluviicola riflensis]|nr:MAG: hypothetical protein CHH17_00425 [Candidatus Fluviicola riflensis]OGS78362.1 MAG: hypothetical protein A3D31_15490 [Candidatus Fluviicola riflensis]OGS85428.1 MAG: hypothetical protein A2724_12425 [Fluviicola sp. RIFCSPHIGHO2_01_FULL_43_53]OGS87470.1 MAG: hypothetical protein A3E30_08845 [Fluviicola sp. RIFCSPHIGHO2_12_FULL_43_24]